MNSGITIKRPLVRAAKIATVSLKRNWLIMPLSLALYIAWMIVGRIVGNTGQMLAPILFGLASLVALTQFYSWCWRALRGEVIKPRDALGLTDHIFSNIGFIGFILWILFALLRPFGTEGSFPVLMFIHLGIAFLFNPLAEVAVLGMGAQGTLFTEAFRITKEHLIVWFLPIVILIALNLVLGSMTLNITEIVMDFAASFNVIFPAGYLLSITTSLFSSNSYEPSWASAIFSVILAIPLVCWFTIFRLALLEELE